MTGEEGELEPQVFRNLRDEIDMLDASRRDPTEVCRGCIEALKHFFACLLWLRPCEQNFREFHPLEFIELTLRQPLDVRSGAMGPRMTLNVSLEEPQI